MALHVYLSVGRQLEPNGPFLQPATGDTTNVMRYRGDISVDDDPVGFKRKMSAQGHAVAYHKEMVGSKNEASGHVEYMMGEL